MTIQQHFWEIEILNKIARQSHQNGVNQTDIHFLSEARKFNNLNIQQIRTCMKISREQLEERLNRIKKNSQILINRLDKTMSGIVAVRQDLSDKGAQMSSWVERYQTVLTTMAQGLTEEMRTQGIPEGSSAPVLGNVVQVVSIMLDYQQIMILSGAGVSKDSGVPVFRGDDGLYKDQFQVEGIKYRPEQFITYQMFSKHPSQIWKWIDKMYDLISSKKPCQNHRLIHQIASNLARMGKKITIVTTNIDGFHKQFQYDGIYKVIEIHGNINNQICEVCQSIQIYKGIQQACKKCNFKAMRPDILFFDEFYNQTFGGEAQKAVYPFVISIGSSLQTGLPNKLVGQASQAVEINPKCVVKTGKVYQFHKQAKQVLVELKNSLDTIKVKIESVQ